MTELQKCKLVLSDKINSQKNFCPTCQNIRRLFVLLYEMIEGHNYVLPDKMIEGHMYDLKMVGARVYYRRVYVLPYKRKYLFFSTLNFITPMYIHIQHGEQI